MFEPVGGRAQKHADARVVAATHHELEAMVREGTLREDLYYRLKGAVLRTPALAKRPLDAAITELELRLVRDAMTATGGNQSEAARRLGISRVGLIKKLTRLGLR